MFVPVLVLALAFVGWTGFQMLMLIREADALKSLQAGQEQAVQQSGKLRNGLDAIARETLKLADGGNPNARLIVDELRKRGVTINPSTLTAQPPNVFGAESK
jgi:hypothetical protein